MSKFIDRLKKLSEGTPQPMGFRKADAGAKKPKIQLVAIIPGKDIAVSGALPSLDAGIVQPRENAEIPDLITEIADAEEIPWGIHVMGGEESDSEALLKAGVDFVVFPSSAPLSGLLSKDIGRIIEIDSGTADTMVRVLNGMPVDAVLISQSKNSEKGITWDDLSGFQRIAGMVNKPVIAPIPAGISKEELQTLWEGGIDGVMVEAAGKGGGDTVKKLRGIIEGLEYPSAKQGEKRTAIAPRVHFETRPEQEEEEEEE